MKKEEFVKVLSVKPGEKCYVDEIENSFYYMKGFVGGDIECCNLDDNMIIICNRDGKNLDLPLNRAIYDEQGKMVDIIHGNFLVCYVAPGSEDISSIPEKYIDKYKDKFLLPEKFVIKDGVPNAIKYEPKDLIERLNEMPSIEDMSFEEDIFDLGLGDIEIEKGRGL